MQSKQGRRERVGFAFFASSASTSGVCRQSAKQDREEEEDEASAAESDSEPDGERPSRDIALRPRSKRVSFSLDDIPFEDEASSNLILVFFYI